MTAMSQTPPASNLPLPYGPPITLAMAKTIMVAAEREANANNWPMAIAIVDSTGHLVLFQRTDHTQLASMEVSVGKATTAVRFKRPTKAFEDAIGAGGAGARVITLPGVVALEGGVPIVHGGQVIGAIGVSGMLSAQDAQVAFAGLAAIAD